MLNLAVFVSGRGTNFISVFNKIRSGELDAEIKFVVSDNKDCQAIEFAKENQIPVIFVSEKSKENFFDYESLKELFDKNKIGLIVLAGFLKKIPDTFVDSFENRIINIHPALLPSFGGKGMYGINVHKAVFEKSCKVSGATVHFVNKIYDNGKIIFQKAVDISSVESAEEIAKKVLAVEHEILPFVIKKFCENKIKIINNRVILE